MAVKEKQSKFPSEIIDLPSKGLVYPKDSPLRSGQIEVKYMTAREEDILTSQNLISKGLVVDKLLESLILTEKVNIDDLVLGDKNAVMVAARILAYGSDYTCQVINPNTLEPFTHTFSLTDCPFKTLPEGIDGNDFEVELPFSKNKVNYKILTGKEEKAISNEIEQIKKIGTEVIPELTTRLRYIITAVDGNTDKNVINNTVQNMLARDSFFLRSELLRVSPDIDMVTEVEAGGETVKVDIPMTANFFWPSSQ